MSRTDAVEALYQDMAARHRARFRSIHVCCWIGTISQETLEKGITNGNSRSSKSSNWQRPMMWNGLTSDNYLLRTSSSHFLIGSQRLLVGKLSLLSVLRLFTSLSCISWWGGRKWDPFHWTWWSVEIDTLGKKMTIRCIISYSVPSSWSGRLGASDLQNVLCHHRFRIPHDH